MLLSLYRKAQYLSIDIVLGAVILLRFFSKQLEVQPTVQEYILLGSAVWLIYTLDHLRDAAKLKQPTRNRYLFHQKHKNLLIGVATALVLVDVGLLFTLEARMLLFGALLALISVSYLLVQKVLSRKRVKELFVALIYSAGVLLVPFVHADRIEVPLFVQLSLLALANLVFFSWIEKEEDTIDGFDSIATEITEGKVEKVVLTMIALGISISLLQDFNAINLYFLLAFAGYFVLLVHKEWAPIKIRFRSIGDGVFLIPILFG